MNNKKIKVLVKDVVNLNLRTFNFSNIDFINYLDTGSITNNNIIGYKKILSSEQIPSRAKRAVTNNTIVFSSVRPNQCHFGILENVPKNTVVSTGFITMDVKNDFDPYYIYYCITNPINIKYLSDIASSATSAYPSIVPEDIANMTIEIYENILLQKQVSAILRTLDSKIAINNRINSTLESMAKTLYDYWFLQFDFPDENGRPYKSSGGKMVWNDELKREIPEGWLFEELNTLSSKINVGFVGTIDKFYCNKELGYQIVRPAEMKLDGIDYDNLRYITKEFYESNKKSQLHKYDVLLSRCGKDGIPNIYDSNEKAQLLNGVIITPISGKDSVFIKMALETEYVQQQIKNGTGGSVQGVINTKTISKLKVLYNYEIVKLYCLRMEKVVEMKSNLKRENQKLKSLREFLLPLLMNGQVGFKHN